jgi:hypothetical protein
MKSNKFFYSFIGVEQKEHNVVTVLVSEGKLPQEEKEYFDTDKFPEIPFSVLPGSTMDIVFTGGPRILKKCVIKSPVFDGRTPKKLLKYESPEDGITFSYNGKKVWAVRKYVKKM